MIDRIKFLDNYDEFEPGDVTRLEQTLMARLVRAGRAEVYKPKAKKKAEDKKEAKAPKAQKPKRQKRKTEKAVME